MSNIALFFFFEKESNILPNAVLHLLKFLKLHLLLEFSPADNMFNRT